MNKSTILGAITITELWHKNLVQNGKQLIIFMESMSAPHHVIEKVLRTFLEEMNDEFNRRRNDVGRN